jgi:deoxyribodipyrimidine photolyase-related protein
MKIFLVFPTQLFKDIEPLKEANEVYVIEEEIYFTKYKFHKLKLAFHRATMKKYYDYLRDKKFKVRYFDFDEDYLKHLKNHDILFYDPVDHDLLKKLRSNSKKYKYTVDLLETPEFITSYDDLEQYHKKQSGKKFMHDSSFYRWQRQRLDILTPIGSKYKLSYDDENREAFPEKQKEVFNPREQNNKYIEEAKRYVNKNFKDNWGSLENFIYPIDHEGAKRWLDDFVKNRFKLFGKYEDAIHSEVNFGYHSVLSPLLNTGLLTDQDILDKVLPLKSKVPISSFEGYIRQVIGWKQAMRYLYEFHFDKFDDTNSLKHNNKISKRFWDGTTGIPPIDDCIKKVNDYGYLHHIERLMVMGQFFLLTMTKPTDVFDWYISLVSMDAYQWVMYPNIFGMIMYADGGFMMTRPYFSSSAYIKKMSNYKKNEQTVKLKDGNEYKWYDIWDALYYNLIDKHYEKFKKIYAIARNTYHWDNKSKEEKSRLLKLAKLYLDYL